MKRSYWVFANLFCLVVSGLAGLLVYSLFAEKWVALVMVAVTLVVTNFLIVDLFFGQYVRFIETVELALLHFKDNEYSLRIPTQRDQKLRKIAQHFHEVADSFHHERSNLLQRELLLDRVFDTVSSALLLIDGREKVALCNPAGRQLLNDGKNLKGLALQDLLQTLSPALKAAISNKTEVLFTLEGEDNEPEIWNMSCEEFRLQGQEHTLYHFKQMTRTLSRAEVSTWKKVIRVFSHELNNSLGPITSLAHSAKEVISRIQTPPKEEDILNRALDTIGDSAKNLANFLSSYAQFARLPAPIPKQVSWLEMLTRLQAMATFTLVGNPPARPGFIDEGQLTQVLINLVKNAKEADSPIEDITVEISEYGEWHRIVVSDRGCGMQDAQLKQALLPFYSTKREGTGLGLSLCREIVDAHGGRISLVNREGGGLQISVWLPVYS